MRRRLDLGGLIIGSAALVALSATGCATIKPMALSAKMDALDPKGESIALMTVKTANEHKPSYQPNVSHVFVWLDETDNRKKYSFKVDEPYNQVKGEFNEYLISLSLPPGRYTLREIFGTSGVFPVRGLFAVPIFTRFEIKPSTLVYLGRVEAVVRERKDESELRAGPVIPLIDQAVTGFAGGTFHIRIVDNYEQDLPVFTQRYPLLGSHAVERAVLPPWRKPTEEEMK